MRKGGQYRGSCSGLGPSRGGLSWSVVPGLGEEGRGQEADGRWALMGTELSVPRRLGSLLSLPPTAQWPLAGPLFCWDFLWLCEKQGQDHKDEGGLEK